MDEKEACESFLIGGTSSGEKLGLALVGRETLRRSLIQLSADGWGYAPSLLVVLPEVNQSWFKVRRGGHEEIPLVQGKEQQPRFAGAAVKRYPTSKVRETQVRR